MASHSSVSNDSAGDFLLTLNQSRCYYLAAIDLLILLQDFNSIFFSCTAGSRLPTSPSQHNNSSKAMKRIRFALRDEICKDLPPPANIYH